MLIGAHLSIANGVAGLIEQIGTLQINALQIFLSAPQNWKASSFNDTNIEEFKNLKNYAKVITVHAPYIVNLASLNDKLRNISKHKVKQEILLVDNLGIDYYILHPGSPKIDNPEGGITNLAESINKVVSAIPDLHTKILLEWSAGEGNEIGKNIPEMSNLIRLISNKEVIGICLDTCHMFASGINISDKNSFCKFKTDLEKNKLLQYIKVIHANDSKGPLGSRKDRHEHIGKGFIGIEGFKNFIEDDYFSKLPFIIETPKENDMDKTNLSVLKSLSKL